MSQPAGRHLGYCLVAIFLASFSSTGGAADALALHAQVDQLLESAAIGPLPPLADDAEFVRRVYLDLVGVVPTSAEARVFLDDKSADKRSRLVDQLLGDPRYTRWWATVFDVMLMERRPDKVVKATDFQRYLYQSILDNKPYNQLAREIIGADVVKGANPPASRFLLDRDVEPNLLTRDIGRLFFGMDLQCAQCHDHPLVDDYAQSDYYGLYAFVNRSFLFTDKKDKKAPKLMAEKADGDVSFKSVFTGDEGQGVKPRLPRDVAIVEPAVAKGQEYLVPPEKDARPVPRYSRRQKLAELLESGENLAFNRNIVNRLWAQLMGRGLVHPVDFQHSDNPPSQPELLDLLAREFRARRYDIKWFLRELVLTRAYQRSCQLPAPAEVNVDQVAARLHKFEAELQQRQAARAAASAEVERITTAIDLLKPAKTPAAELAKLEEAVKLAIAARDKARKEAQDAQQAATTRDEAAQLLNAAVAANQAVIDKLASDKIAVEAARKIVDRAQRTRAEATQAQTKASASAKTAEQAAAKLSAAEQALAKVKTSSGATSELEKLQAELQAAQNRLAATTVAAKTCVARENDAQALLAYQQLAKSDRVAAERAWNSLTESWANLGYVATLKPLAPEQFGLSLMQATGALAAQGSASAAAIEKQPPEELKKAEDQQKQPLKARLLEQKTYEAVRGNLNSIITLYGGQPGQDFAATLNQALFFGNGPLVSAWLKPQAGYLVDRLNQQKDERLLVEELYLSVFSRLPSSAETADVVAFLEAQPDKRVAALQEITWALLSSNEFRFNH
ncbi:MAG: DUF1549 domain-containing protein [Planctomycetes bacterium]|nr:DUF1549 domain-containing protein [Planctomycetota bacterium]